MAIRWVAVLCALQITWTMADFQSQSQQQFQGGGGPELNYSGYGGGYTGYNNGPAPYGSPYSGRPDYIYRGNGDGPGVVPDSYRMGPMGWPSQSNADANSLGGGTANLGSVSTNNNAFTQTNPNSAMGFGAGNSQGQGFGVNLFQAANARASSGNLAGLGFRRR